MILGDAAPAPSDMIARVKNIGSVSIIVNIAGQGETQVNPGRLIDVIGSKEFNIVTLSGDTMFMVEITSFAALAYNTTTKGFGYTSKGWITNFGDYNSHFYEREYYLLKNQKLVPVIENGATYYKTDVSLPPTPLWHPVPEGFIDNGAQSYAKVGSSPDRPAILLEQLKANTRRDEVPIGAQSMLPASHIEPIKKKHHYLTWSALAYLLLL